MKGYDRQSVSDSQSKKENAKAENEYILFASEDDYFEYVDSLNF